jgi:hypothetical protein
MSKLKPTTVTTNVANLTQGIVQGTPVEPIPARDPAMLTLWRLSPPLRAVALRRPG